MTQKTVHDSKVDGVTPFGFIIGSVSEYRLKTGQRIRVAPSDAAPALSPTPEHHIEASVQDERLARTMAHAAHESVRASLGRPTSKPRDVSTAIWSAGLQGVGAAVLKAASEVRDVG